MPPEPTWPFFAGMPPNISTSDLPWRSDFQLVWPTASERVSPMTCGSSTSAAP